MNIKYQIGIMQGRLSPRNNNKIQSFPDNHWENEFILAKRIGLNFIEWIIDFHEFKSNPIFAKEGVLRIKELIKETGVYVPSICVDYLATFPIIDESKGYESKELLYEIIEISRNLGIKIIEIPLVGSASPKNAHANKKYVNFFNSLSETLTKNSVQIGLETDLDPISQKNFINKIKNENVGLNYDIGNSVFWGYSLRDEIKYFGKKIINVHLKDCTVRDYSVPFGQGDSDFNHFFKLLQKINYTGDFVIQGARGEDDFNVVFEQFEFIKSILN